MTKPRDDLAELRDQAEVMFGATPKSVLVSMTGSEIKEIAQPMMDAVNRQIRTGTPIDQIFMSMAYVLGASMANRGVVLDLTGPLEEELPPFAAGYRATIAERTS